MPLALSFILLSEQTEPSQSNIQDFVAASWPDLPPINNYSAGEGTIAFDIGGTQVALGIMPAPFPWSDLEKPCATSILWKDAENTVKNQWGQTRLIYPTSSNKRSNGVNSNNPRFRVKLSLMSH